MPSKSTTLSTLTIYVPSEIKKELKELAKSENRSVSNLVSTILTEYLELQD